MGGFCRAVGFSPDGRWLAILRPTEKSMDTELWLVDLASSASPPSALQIAPHDGDATISPPRWLPDGSSFYLATDVDRDLGGIARYDVDRADWEYVLELDHEAGCWMDWHARSLLVVTNTDGYSVAELRDPHTLEIRRRIELPHDGVAGEWTFSRDGNWLAYQFSSPLEPGDVWICDARTGHSKRLTTSPCAIDRSTLSEPELHRLASFDGESIPVFVYRPRPASKGPRPVVAVIHGGPEGQSRPLFNPLVAYLVARGYGVLVPNVRGSTGYGKRYHHLDDARKRLDAVRDLEALHDWLRNDPTLDADRAALFGGSYGGYMVLSGVAFQPDRWAAAIDIVGISNLATFLENTSRWRRTLREREYGSLERDRDFLIEIAPITHVDQMRAPLFIIHGANDPRVPLSETEQLYAALTERGVPCHMLVYPDEGHGLAKLANRLDAYPKAVDFLDEHLGMGMAAK
jgi:dipeptidyl aminopeptidase/acylaminoacyl peptidase